jgi:uncharacterized protein (TIGR02001 family)
MNCAYRYSGPMKMFVIFVALFAIRPAAAAEFSGYLTLTSDYVRRGVSQSDGDAALQLGVDFSFEAGFYVGAWGSTVDISNGPTRHRDRELDLYAGYVFDVTNLWRVSANLVSYLYPGQTGDVDYDYVEFSLAANYDDHFWLEYSYSPDLYHTNLSSENLEFYAEFSLWRNWSIGGGVGYYDVSELSGQGYGYWQLGVTGNFRYADIDLRYHDTNRSVYLVSTDELSQARVAATVTIPF